MAAISQYPQLYGGKQKEYGAAAAAAVQRGVQFLRAELSKADVDCKAIFFSLLEQFAAQRREIAQAHHTNNWEEFGRRSGQYHD